MSEQEPGAVEQWLDLAEGAETSIDDRYSVDGYALLAFARAHDAEDVRRAAEFAAMHAEAARLAGRLIEREEYIDEREALLERLQNRVVELEELVSRFDGDGAADTVE